MNSDGTPSRTPGSNCHWLTTGSAALPKASWTDLATLASGDRAVRFDGQSNFAAAAASAVDAFAGVDRRRGFNRASARHCRRVRPRRPVRASRQSNMRSASFSYWSGAVRVGADVIAAPATEDFRSYGSDAPRLFHFAAGRSYYYAGRPCLTAPRGGAIFGPRQISAAYLTAAQTRCTSSLSSRA